MIAMSKVQEKVMLWLEHRVWEHYTVGHVILAIIALILIIGVFRYLLTSLAVRKHEKLFDVRCRSCAWKGQVKFKIQNCPQCSESSLRFREVG